MAVDSIIAKPTNKVRVMVEDASGCCAIEFSADETDRPSPNAGIMHPMPVVNPAVMIDATAIKVVLSMLNVFDFQFICWFTVLCCGRYIHCGQYAKDVSLHHSGQHAKDAHDNRKKERRY